MFILKIIIRFLEKLIINILSLLTKSHQFKLFNSSELAVLHRSSQRDSNNTLLYRGQWLVVGVFVFYFLIQLELVFKETG